MPRFWAVIFDYVETLCMRGSHELYLDVAPAIKRLSQLGMRLALVSLAGSQSVPEREREIHSQSIFTLFDYVLVSSSAEEKARHCDEVLEHLGLPAEQVVVVDDRIDRCIEWGNQRGCLTIRLRRPNTMFAVREPENLDQQPVYTISDLERFIELLDAVECGASTRSLACSGYRTPGISARVIGGETE